MATAAQVKSVSKQECERMAKSLADLSSLPQDCREYIERQRRLKAAFDGASPADRAGIRARQTGSLTHAQLQRRWTSRRDPLDKNKNKSK
ncbi:unnamed protein product [Chrysoparadoxa australica]